MLDPEWPIREAVIGQVKIPQCSTSCRSEVCYPFWSDTRMPAYYEDRLASLKSEYKLAAKAPSNLCYGYVRAA